MQGLSLGLRVRRDAAEFQKVGQVVENRFNELLSGGEFPAGGGEGSEGGYRWTMEEVPAAGEEGVEADEGMAPLKIRVESPTGGSWEFFTIFPREEDS